MISFSIKVCSIYLYNTIQFWILVISLITINKTLRLQNYLVHYQILLHNYFSMKQKLDIQNFKCENTFLIVRNYFNRKHFLSIAYVEVYERKQTIPV